VTRVFTTGQVARIFSVNINTVIKWFDDGKLSGFRLPRSNERRIYRESVLGFMDQHDISADLLRAFDEEQANKGKRGRRTTPGPSPYGKELRTFPRKPVELKGQVDDSGHLVPVTVRNLSMGGVYVTGFDSHDTRIPQEFTLSMDGADGAPRFDGTCQLVHLKRTQTEAFGLGCRFTSIDPGTLQVYLQTI
jgi:hypothetical protein